MDHKKSLTGEQRKALDAFADSMDGRIRTHLNSCVRCGLCAESCHFYVSTGDERYMPAHKVERLARVYRRYHTLAGRVLPRWIGAGDFDETAARDMADVFFGGCTMCGRCSLHCSVGVDIPFLVRTARKMISGIGLVSPGLKSTVATAMEKGNNMGIPRKELVDTLEWLEEDLKLEVNDERASIPLDAVGKRILYTLNPREPKFFPLTISAIAKILYAAGESWTISTNCYDVTNYPYFSGEDEKAGELIRRLVNEVKTLDASMLVLSECGHGSRAIRWEGPNWIGHPYPFRIMSVIELFAFYLRDGRIRLDPSRNGERVTLHDPCNLVRSGGVIEEQRFVLSHAAMEVMEMTPNREHNYCCGGGGGQLAMSEYAERRVAAGKAKADQIRKTHAEIVATPCHSCVDQLMELNKHYSLGVKIRTVAEIVADALVLPGETRKD